MKMSNPEINYSEYLTSLITAKLTEKNYTLDFTEQMRLQKELSYIEEGGLAQYFYYVYKLVEVCKKLNIVREPESGAIACWYLNYVLGIIYRNPLVDDYDFEQFYIPNKIDFSSFQVNVPYGYANIIIGELTEEIELFSEHCLMYSTHYKVYEHDFFVEDERSPELQSFLIAENSSLNRLQEVVNHLPEQLHPQNLPLYDNRIIQQSTYKHPMDNFRVTRFNVSENANNKLDSNFLTQTISRFEYPITLDEVIKFVTKTTGMSVEEFVVLYNSYCDSEDYDYFDRSDDTMFRGYKRKLSEGVIYELSSLTEKEIIKLILYFHDTFVQQEIADHSSEKRSEIIFDYWLTYYSYYFREINRLNEEKVIENPYYISDRFKTIDISLREFAQILRFKRISNTAEMKEFLLELNYRETKKRTREIHNVV